MNRSKIFKVCDCCGTVMGKTLPEHEVLECARILYAKEQVLAARATAIRKERAEVKARVRAMGLVLASMLSPE